MEWPLVGRDVELETLLDADAGWSGAIITGPSGIGKTRLLRTALLHFDDAGTSVTSVSATESASSIPFGAFAHVLPKLRDGPLTGINGLRQIRALLTSLGGARLPVVGVDDAQSLDDHSAVVVHDLVVSGAARVIMTLRDDTSMPAAIEALEKDPSVVQLRLGPLQPNYVTELLEAALEGPVDAGTVTEMNTMAQGNPLFLRELFLSVTEHGLLHRDGEWALRGPIQVDAQLSDLVHSRLADLPEPARRALEIVTVGEPLPTHILPELMEADVEQLLHDKGLITFDQSHVRMAHPLQARTIEANLTPSRLRQIEGRLADLLADWGRHHPEDVMRVARWHLDAGTSRRPDLMVLAAKRALAIGDLDRAREFATAAGASGGGFEAAAVLGRVLARQGHTIEASESLAVADAIATTDDERAETIALRAEVSAIDPRLAPTDAELQQISDPQVRGRLAAQLALIALRQGRVADARSTADAVISRPDASPHSVIQALSVASLAAAETALATTALRLAQQGLDLWPRVAADMPNVRGYLAASRIQGLVYTGEIGPAVDRAEIALQDSIAAGSPAFTGLWHGVAAWTHLFAGSLDKAMRHFRQAEDALSTSDLLGSLPEVRTWHLLALAQSTYQSAIPDLRRLIDGDRPRHNAQAALAARRAGAWEAAAAGRSSEAAQLASTAASLAAEEGQRTAAIFAAHDAVRFGFPDAVAPMLGGWAREVEGALLTTMMDHALALSRRDPDRLDGVAEQFEAAGAMLLAAEASAQASSLHERSGDRRRAGRSALRFDVLIARCPEATTPAMALRSSPLTRREVEVALLAARGLSSRQVADELVISVRTVDNHLASIYTKLDIHSRRDLAAVLTPEGR